MSRDARFEDAGTEAPLRLRALDGEDLRVVSALVQDGVTRAADMAWKKRGRRFACLVNRFRWEDAEAARKGGRDFERVRAMLVVEDVRSVRSQGIGLGEATATSLLGIGWQPGEGGAGQVLLTFAGGGTIAVEVEALEVTLTDVTRPYRAVSSHRPQHD